MTPDPRYILLFVESLAASAAFYAGLLQAEPVENSPTFALFVSPAGLKLGLWSRHTAEPAPVATGGGAEVGFHVDSKAEVDALHTRWAAQGAAILQAPGEMDFGYTFTAADPDGHRLRVFCPAPR